MARDMDKWRAANKAWRLANPDKVKAIDAKYRAKNAKKRNEVNKARKQRDPNIARDEHYRYRFGVTLAWVESKWREQSGCCGICKTPIKLPDRKTHLDHDHKTGNVRGLLCDCCNHLLGKAKDSAEILIAAANYLTRSSSEIIVPLSDRKNDAPEPLGGLKP